MHILCLCSSFSVMGVLSYALPSTVRLLSHDHVHNTGALRISYEVPLHTRFFCATNSFARFIGITQKTYTNPEDAAEFVPIKNGYRYVDSYCDRLCFLYTEPDMHHLRFDRWQASEICTYKSRGTAIGHEYLIATLHDADNREIQLRLERGVQLSSTHVTHSGLTAASTLSVDSTNRGGSPADGPGRSTINEASSFTSSAFSEDRQPADHFRFDDGYHVPLPLLVVLASTVDEHSKTHQSAHHNCYWFCHVVSAALKKRFNHKLLSGDQQDRLHNILLYQNVDIDEVLDTYDASWNVFIRKVFCLSYA